ncbi:hypothetical protein BG015_008843 [Linnemannia schmuckeri]|uniref:RlpA-like protein double-psi beta-barrel domain-containing protein n=1 Tax=Linnemannia schmuckeri TaxID=64567 RepID=A0A9P5VA74_9FUNG|nr:hypothetical protein BG015_008843 [Linnemannia schmuckeri]
MQFTKFTLMVAMTLFALLSVISTSEAATKIQFGKKASGKATWFNGRDAEDVACYGILENKDVNAKDSWHIAAMRLSQFTGGVKKACFECLRVTAGSRSVIARIIDDCSSCGSGHVDLSLSAFTKLAPKSKGVVSIKYEFVRCPSSGSNLKWPKSPAVKKN